VLLLFASRGNTTAGMLPMKLAEYIAAQRPILAIAEEGEAADIIRQGRLGHGYFHTTGTLPDCNNSTFAIHEDTSFRIACFRIDPATHETCLNT